MKNASHLHFLLGSFELAVFVCLAVHLSKFCNRGEQETSSSPTCSSLLLYPALWRSLHFRTADNERYCRIRGQRDSSVLGTLLEDGYELAPFLDEADRQSCEFDSTQRKTWLRVPLTGKRRESVSLDLKLRIGCCDHSQGEIDSFALSSCLPPTIKEN